MLYYLVYVLLIRMLSVLVQVSLFFTFVTQKYSQVQHGNFFLLTFSFPIMLTHKTGSVRKMEWSRWRIFTGNVSNLSQEDKNLTTQRQKGTFFKWNKDKKQQQTGEIGRHGWNHKMRGKKYKHYNNMQIKLKSEVSEILNHSSPSGQVLWREKVSFQDTSTRSTVTMSVLAWGEICCRQSI